MRSRLLALLALPALCAPALAGCGAEEVAGVDVAKAAAATTGKGTARMTLRMHMTGLGLPSAIDIEAHGVTALGAPRMNIAFDFGELLSAAGAQGLDGGVEMRLDGAHLYVRPPEIQALDLPEWIGLDLRRVAEAMGIDPDAAGVLFTMDPASQLRGLRAAGGLEPVGTEEVGGAQTTHLKGTMSTRDYLAALPPAQRRRAEKAIAQVEALGGESAAGQEVPTELWVDGDSIVRRMRMSMRMPSPGAGAPGQMDMTYELSDFGAELDVAKPEGVVDYTGKLVRALSSAGLKGRGGTSAG
jgi:hypothetical protein